MKLFTVDENNEVVVNAPWIKLIPEFKNVYSQAKVMKKGGNYQVYANKQMAFIYFMLDFSSPLKTWNEEDKQKEALRYCSLTEADVRTETMKKALAYYEFLQIEACRPIKTYRALQLTADAMDEYFASINFKEVDKQGKLKYTPNQAVDNAAKMNKFYDEMHKLSIRISTELEQNTGIRGKSTMGDKEIAYANEKLKGLQDKWDETTGNVPEGPTMMDIHEILTKEEE